MNIESLMKLTEYLVNSNEQNITLTFKEIEQIIGESLSDDAKSKPGWWYNRQKNPQAHYWMDAGFQTINCKDIQVRGNVCFTKEVVKPETSKAIGNEDENAYGESVGLIEDETDWWTKVKWLNPLGNVIATVLTIVFSLVPNAPIWERFLLLGLLAFHYFLNYFPLLKKKRKLKLALFACSLFSIVLVFSHFIYNEFNLSRHSDETLSMTILPLKYKPLPVKVSMKEDTVGFYCSNMPPVIEAVLNNQDETVATVTSIDIIIKDYDKFSPDDIVEHSWINDDPSDIIFMKEDGSMQIGYREFENNDKSEYITIGGKVYHDLGNQELCIVDNGIVTKDVELTVDRYKKLRFQPEIKDSGHYTFCYSIHYTNIAGQKECMSDEMEIYFLEEKIEDLLEANDNSIDYFVRIGRAFFCRGSYSDALEFYEKALSLSKKANGEEDPDTATMYHNAAGVYYAQGNYKKALTYCKNAAEISEKVLGEEDSDTIATYIMLALIYKEQGKYDDALTYYEKALNIVEGGLEEENPVVGATYNNLAGLYMEQGKYNDALTYYDKALNLLIEVLGEEAPETAIGYNNLAGVYKAKGYYLKALDFYYNALYIQEKVLGEKHPETATTYNNLGVTYDAKGDYENAIIFYKKALDVRKEALGKEHPDTAKLYNNMAAVYEEQGDYDKALDYYQMALDIQEKVWGENHPDTAATYSNMGLMYYDQMKYDEALEFFDKDLKICKKVLGEEHPDTATAYNNLGLVYKAQKKYEEALECYTRAVEIRGKVFGEYHPFTASTYNNVARIFEVYGWYDEALILYEKALDIFEKELKEHPDTATTYNNIGALYYQKKDFKSAEEYFSEALRIFEKVLGSDHPKTKNTKMWLEEVEKNMEQ